MSHDASVLAPDDGVLALIVTSPIDVSAVGAIQAADAEEDDEPGELLLLDDDDLE